MEGRPKKFNCPEVMKLQMDDYFNACDLDVKVIENDKGQTKIVLKPYTISGLCLHLEIDRVTLLDYEKDAKFSSTIKQAKQRVENWIEEKSLTGAINPTTAIFNLKNNFGWEDKRQVETADVSKEKYESWLKENHKMLDVTPDTKQLEE